MKEKAFAAAQSSDAYIILCGSAPATYFPLADRPASCDLPTTPYVRSPPPFSERRKSQLLRKNIFLFNKAGVSQPLYFITIIIYFVRTVK